MFTILKEKQYKGISASKVNDIVNEYRGKGQESSLPFMLMLGGKKCIVWFNYVNDCGESVARKRVVDAYILNTMNGSLLCIEKPAQNITVSPFACKEPELSYSQYMDKLHRDIVLDRCKSYDRLHRAVVPSMLRLYSAVVEDVKRVEL